MAKLETVKVVSGDGFVIINKKDMNESHKEYKEPKSKK